MRFFGAPTATTVGGLPRSSHWPSAREKWLRDHPACAACGTTKKVEVHHIIPVEELRRRAEAEPDLAQKAAILALELDPANFISLCRRLLINHHFVVGHLRNWKRWSANVRQIAAGMLAGGS